MGPAPVSSEVPPGLAKERGAVSPVRTAVPVVNQAAAPIVHAAAPAVQVAAGAAAPVVHAAAPVVRVAAGAVDRVVQTAAPAGSHGGRLGRAVTPGAASGPALVLPGHPILSSRPHPYAETLRSTIPSGATLAHGPSVRKTLSLQASAAIRADAAAVFTGFAAATEGKQSLRAHGLTLDPPPAPLPDRGGGSTSAAGASAGGGAGPLAALLIFFVLATVIAARRLVVAPDRIPRVQFALLLERPG